MEINTGDTAWVLTSAALVILMTPALGFFCWWSLLAVRMC